MASTSGPSSPPPSSAGGMLVDEAVIPPATPAATYDYAVERFDYSAATATDCAQIGALYGGYFSLLGLEFDPSLDTDFVTPCAYYHNNGADAKPPLPHPNGAFFVVRRRFVVGGAQEGDASSVVSHIVGTIGVRAYAFPPQQKPTGAAATNEDLFRSFIDGIADPTVAERATLLQQNGGEGTRFCELKRMILHTECQGKGLGKALLNAAMGWAFAPQTTSSAPAEASRLGLSSGGGFAAMLLDTKRWLGAANALYERLGGFVECGNYNGNYRADRFMVAFATAAEEASL